MTTCSVSSNQAFSENLWFPLTSFNLLRMKLWVKNSIFPLWHAYHFRRYSDLLKPIHKHQTAVTWTTLSITNRLLSKSPHWPDFLLYILFPFQVPMSILEVKWIWWTGNKTASHITLLKYFSTTYSAKDIMFRISFYRVNILWKLS